MVKNNVDCKSESLSDPAFRESILKNIAPTREAARNWRQTLLAILELEMTYRDDSPNDGKYFENLYWCGFLLYLAGDPTDVPLMWRAKHINMDTGCGFDGQSFVGAGVEETVRYLEQRGEGEIAAYIKSMKESGELDELAEWERWRADYYYRKPW